MVRLQGQVTAGLASMYTCCMLQLLVCSKHPSVCSACREFWMVMCDCVIVTCHSCRVKVRWFNSHLLQEMCLNSRYLYKVSPFPYILLYSLFMLQCDLQELPKYGSNYSLQWWQIKAWTRVMGVFFLMLKLAMESAWILNIYCSLKQILTEVWLESALWSTKQVSCS